MINKALIFLALVLFSGFSFAKEIIVNGQRIDIGPLILNGSGCPAGSTVAVATPNNTQIAILFSDYLASTNQSNQVAISDCNMVVPISVGPGLRVGIIDIDWRGTVFTGSETIVNFHREFFFSGSSGPVDDTNWVGSGIENFLLNDKPVAVVYSGCNGEDLLARADTAATVVGPNGLFSLRAADVNAELLLTVRVEDC